VLVCSTPIVNISEEIVISYGWRIYKSHVTLIISSTLHIATWRILCKDKFGTTPASVVLSADDSIILILRSKFNPPGNGKNLLASYYSRRCGNFRTCRSENSALRLVPPIGSLVGYARGGSVVSVPARINGGTVEIPLSNESVPSREYYAVLLHGIRLASRKRYIGGLLRGRWFIQRLRGCIRPLP